MVDLIGFVAGLLFAVSAFPLLYSTLKTKKTEVPWLSIGLVFFGALLMFTYGLCINSWPLIADMVVTAGCWGTIGVVKWKSGIK